MNCVLVFVGLFAFDGHLTCAVALTTTRTHHSRRHIVSALHRALKTVRLAYVSAADRETKTSRPLSNQRRMLSFLQRKLTGAAAATDTGQQQSPIRTSMEAELATEAIDDADDALLKELGYRDTNDLKETIYDALRTIRDPEKPHTLEDLNVVYEEGIFVQNPTKSNVYVVRIEFNPTVPHCSLATLIGLCIRVKIERSLPHDLKLDIYIKKGAHSTEDEINKQINDKERIAAAMENPNLRELVENCIKDEE